MIEPILVFLEGILAFISPCFLPMVPIYITYLIGTDQSDDTKSKVFHSLGFILGFTLIFVLIGAGASSIGFFITSRRDVLEKVAGVIIVFFGLNVMGLIKLNILNKTKKLNVDIKSKGFFGAFFFGIVFSIGWTPCLGPFLTSAILKASNSETVYQGMFLLFLFSMGLGIPFLITSIIMNQLKGIFTWIKRNHSIVNIISGSILIIVGLMMLFGGFTYYERLFL